MQKVYFTLKVAKDKLKVKINKTPTKSSKRRIKS